MFKFPSHDQGGEPVENAHVRIDNLTKKILVTKSVIAELKHLLEIKWTVYLKLVQRRFTRDYS